MASRVCWNCETKAHHTLREGEIIRYEAAKHRYFGLFRCDECGVASMGLTRNMSEHSGSAFARRALDADRADLIWHPTVAAGKDYEDVPADIAQAADEAHRCFSIAAYRATLILARAVIEASAKSVGVTSGSLYAKIEKLASDGTIRPVVRDAAHGVRDAGNDMAHGDFVGTITESEAEEILFLMAKVLDDVFQTPAMVARRTAAKEARKNGPAPAEADSADDAGLPI